MNCVLYVCFLSWIQLQMKFFDLWRGSWWEVSRFFLAIILFSSLFLCYFYTIVKMGIWNIPWNYIIQSSLVQRIIMWTQNDYKENESYLSHCNLVILILAPLSCMYSGELEVVKCYQFSRMCIKASVCYVTQFLDVDLSSFYCGSYKCLFLVFSPLLW